MAARLNHLTLQSVVAGRGNIKLEFDFRKPMAKNRHNKTSKHPQAKLTRSPKAIVPKKRKTQAASSDSGDMYGSDGASLQVGNNVDDDEDDEESFDWSYSLRDEPTSRPAKRLQQSKGKERSRQRKRGEKNVVQDRDDEIMELSSD